MLLLINKKLASEKKNYDIVGNKRTNVHFYICEKNGASEKG
jgi:hypothetical protein